MSTRTSLVLLFAFATAVSAAASKPVAIDAPGDAIHEYLRRLSGFGYSGAVLIKRGDDTVLRHAYGMAQTFTGRPNTADTAFDIASITKQFTAAAILALEEDGRLRITDPLHKHLPGVPADKHGITLEHLLGHTSGVIRGIPRAPTNAEVLGIVMSRPLSSAPGEMFAYSNSGYILLAAVIEAASGQTFHEYLEQRVFARAGLTSTGFWGALAPRIAPERIAVGHDDFGRSGSPLDWKIRNIADAGHGGVLSTVDDLARWIAALESGRVISRERVERMWTAGKGGYGLGWFVETSNGQKRVWHDGDGDGFGAHLSWTPATRELVVALANVRIDWAPIHVKADEAIHAILAGRTPVMPPDFAERPLTEIAGHAGVYALDADNRFIVSVAGGRLSIGAEGQRATDLLRPAADVTSRAQRTTLAAEALGKYLKGDMAGFKAIGMEDQGALDAVKDEIAAIGGDRGALKSFQVLGTFPAGQPGIDNTIIQLVYERGCGAFKWRWDGLQLEGTYTRSTKSAAPTFIQPTPDGAFVGWNVLEDAPAPFAVTFSTNARGTRALTLSRDGSSVQAIETTSVCAK